MATKSVLKKSVFGGFKKEDVINYIEQLQQENVNLKRELGECSAYKRDFIIAETEKEKAQKELLSLREESEALKVKNAGLLEINAALNLKAEESKATVEKLENSLKNSEEKIKELEHKLAESEENYSKMKEAENIISQAHNTASEIKKEAVSSVENAKAEIENASDRIKTACINFESASSSLKASAENLLAALSQAESKLN